MNQKDSENPHTICPVVVSLRPGDAPLPEGSVERLARMCLKGSAATVQEVADAAEMEGFKLFLVFREKDGYKAFSEHLN